MSGWPRVLLASALVLTLAGLLEPAASAQQMPDPSLIHGKALPAPELPSGVVTVRLVRESIGNNITGHEVRIRIGGTIRTAKTDEQGRAQFPDLPHEGQATAEATVDGEALVSEPFSVPESGGLRVILVSGIAQAAARKKAEDEASAAEPPVRGAVVLGENSRVLMQFEGDALQVFYVLDIVNSARTRVDIGGPLIVELPTEAIGASTLEGSTPAALIRGTRLVVTGPFAPGSTSAQVGFQMPYSGSQLTIAQPWPVALQRVTVGVQKVVNGLTVESPQFTTTSEVQGENGKVFALGNGAALAAGATLTINLKNLPAHSRAPRYITLGLAGIIVAIGVWLSVTGTKEDGAAREAMVVRREELFRQLQLLESNHQTGKVTPEKYLTRRQRIVAELEQIYGELDGTSAGPQGGGEGVAA